LFEAIKPCIGSGFLASKPVASAKLNDLNIKDCAPVKNPVSGKQLRTLIVVLPAMLLLSGCSLDSEYGRLGMPEPATEEGNRILSLWQGSWVAALIVGVFVWGLLLWAIVAYRRKEGDGLPKQVRYNVPLEILYTVAPLLMVLALFYFTQRDQTILTKLDDTQTHSVNVVGWRWSWAFNYEEEGVYDLGTPSDPPVLWLPVDEKVKFELTSPDVIHSFWIPAFLMKMDVVPGRNNQFAVTPNTQGVFKGKCAELCGVDHSRMLFDVKVVSRAEYDAHIAGLKERGQIGKIDSGRSEVAGVS
jgi:cytochrome c oxidase subunit 2